MTNREYLNTLSDEEFLEWCIKYFFSQTHLEMYGTESLTEKVKDMARKMLQAEHTTTADEDFAEIGFVLETTQPLYVCYADDNGRLLYILKFNNEYDTNNEGWNDELVDTVRTIADKKRKEMGWDK